MRDRFHSDDELKQIGAALAEAERTRTIADGAIAALRLLVLTGCRASEILELRWADVDLDAGVFRLRDAKAGARAVPLGTPAVALLCALQRSGETVVGGRKPGSRLTLPALEAAWKKIRTAAGLTAWRRPARARQRRAGEPHRPHPVQQTMARSVGSWGTRSMEVSQPVGAIQA